jgi:hypothetical protein
LVQNEVASKKVSFFLSFILPWLIAIPLQTGGVIEQFQIWTSLIFVSTSNFMIPMLIYFRCKVFREQYNDDRALTDKQLDILKRIHYQSKSLVEHLSRKRNFQNSDASTVNEHESNFRVIRTQFPSGHTESTMSVNYEIETFLDEDVPDPDMEDQREGKLVPMDMAVDTLRRITRKFTLVPDAPNQPPEIESLPNANKEIKPIDAPFQDELELDSIQFDSARRLGRIRTLPTNQNFKAPAFRSVPKWMPCRGSHMAWLVLILSSIATFMNIFIMLIPEGK